MQLRNLGAVGGFGRDPTQLLLAIATESPKCTQIVPIQPYATRPAPPIYPANFLGTLNPATGQVTAVPVVGAAYVPQGGLLFIPGSEHTPQY